MHLETIKIESDETELGYIIINASDFDPATMERYHGDGGAEPLPSVSKLAAHLDTLSDVAAVQALQARDTRKSAGPLYEARLAALAK